MNSSKPAGLTFLLIVIFIQILSPTGAIVEVCYGRNGDNLPSPADTVALYKRTKLDAIRMYEPFADMLEALRGSGLMVAFGPRNEEIKSLAQDPSAAANFVETWILPYEKDVAIKWITIGNEVFPGDIGQFVAGAIRNVNTALQNTGISGIAVTTVLSGSELQNTYPPSMSQFVPDLTEIMKEISSILMSLNSPLMVNTYPYFAYASNPDKISLEYAMLQENPRLKDEDLLYENLFVAMVDGFNAALEKIGSGSVKVLVGESGWPTRGNPPYTSLENARNYNTNLLSYVVQVKTPRRPNVDIDIFFFEMFTEDLKQGEVEQSFGFFTPDMHPIYMHPIYELWPHA